MSKTVTFRNVSLTPPPPPSFTAGFPSRGAWFPDGTMNSVHKVQINLQRLSRALHSKVQMDNNLMNFQGNLRKKKTTTKFVRLLLSSQTGGKKLIYSLTTENSY